MTKDEKQSLLAEHLAKFRGWSYAQLAEAVERTRREHDCLSHVEVTTLDGTRVQMEFNVFWDGRVGEDVRVCCDLTAEPQRPMLGFIPIYTPDVTDGFMMRPDGSFVGEPDAQTA